MYNNICIGRYTYVYHKYLVFTESQYICIPLNYSICAIRVSIVSAVTSTYYVISQNHQKWLFSKFKWVKTSEKNCTVNILYVWWVELKDLVFFMKTKNIYVYNIIYTHTWHVVDSLVNLCVKTYIGNIITIRLDNERS